MGAYVTARSTPPVAAAAFNSNSKTPKTSIDSTRPSIATSKKETRPYLKTINLHSLSSHFEIFAP
jgi:hypothetical protein